MNKNIALLALVVFGLSTTACTSTPTQTEAPVSTDVSAQPVLETNVDEIAPQASEPPVTDLGATESATTSTSDMSLGAGSSGRGH